MIKRVIAILIAVIMLTGCSKVTEAEKERPDESRFAIVEVTGMWIIVADREEGVMYTVSHGTYNGGTFTLLVDKDGKPLIWDGE